MIRLAWDVILCILTCSGAENKIMGSCVDEWHTAHFYSDFQSGGHVIVHIIFNVASQRQSIQELFLATKSWNYIFAFEICSAGVAKRPSTSKIQ